MKFDESKGNKLPAPVLQPGQSSAGVQRSCRRNKDVMRIKAETMDRDTAFALQVCARHQMIERLLRDILFDMNVCMIEGWDAEEYPLMILKSLKDMRVFRDRIVL